MSAPPCRAPLSDSTIDAAACLSDRPSVSASQHGHPCCMDAITDVPLPANEPIHEYAPGSGERTRLNEALGALVRRPDRPAARHRRQPPHGRRRAHRRGPAAPALRACSAPSPTPSTPTRRPRSTPRSPPRPAGRPPRSTSGPRCSCAPPTCWPDRGGRRSPPPPCSASPRPPTRPRSTRRASSSTSGGSTSRSPARSWRSSRSAARGVWNRTDYRPLEGFVYAITPFNFTAIAGNLPTAPALMGNTVVWKPSPTQTFAAYLTMQLLEAAGLPPGVINLVTGDGIAVSDVVLADPRLAGIHFTGSTATFQHLWREVGTNIDRYHTYPRLVGETGGKDFVVAHASARPDVLRTALIRGAFDYQGQKCSAASRAFIPRSVWQQMGDDFLVGHRGAALRRRHRPVQLRRRADRRARLRQERQGDRAGQERGRRDDRRRRRIRRQRRLFRPADGAAVRRPDRRGVLHRVLRADPGGARLRRRRVRPTFSTSSTPARSTR